MFEVSSGHIEASRFANGSATTVNTLRPEFRYVVLFLWILACVVFGWVGLTGQEAGTRIFDSAFCLLGSGLLLFYLHEESSLATNHLIAQGEVTRYRQRRGTHVSYRFVALDGKTYEKTSLIFSRRQFEGEHIPVLYSFEKGERILVLYNPLMPTVSKPLVGFIFYRFKVSESVP